MLTTRDPYNEPREIRNGTCIVKHIHYILWNMITYAYAEHHIGLTNPIQFRA